MYTWEIARTDSCDRRYVVISLLAHYNFHLQHFLCQITPLLSPLTWFSWPGCCCSVSPAQIHPCRGWWWEHSPSGTVACFLWILSWEAWSPGRFTITPLAFVIIDFFYFYRVTQAGQKDLFWRKKKTFHFTCDVWDLKSKSWQDLLECVAVLWLLHLPSQLVVLPHNLCQWTLAWSHLKNRSPGAVKCKIILSW